MIGCNSSSDILAPCRYSNRESKCRVDGVELQLNGLQIGGSDQLGHFDAGYHYIQKLSPSRPVYGLCLPLVVDDSGNKLGKSSTDATAAVWLSAERTSPYAFYQYWRQMPDQYVERVLPYFSLRAMPEVRESPIFCTEYHSTFVDRIDSPRASRASRRVAGTTRARG
jgi:hypothetical protein